uniref:Uncharacterized protein n=1 Tax=Fagus sylvatica TaxID=28930 RepID=A0A2N9ESW5_FAGSY
MDVAAYHWATLQMGPAGPTSEKAAKHMKNTAILVAKRLLLPLLVELELELETKSPFGAETETNHLRFGAAFNVSFGGALHWCIDCTVHVVVAVMTTQETDGVRSFAASNSFVEDLPQPVEGNMQDTPESLLRNSVIEPRVGMEFDSLQQLGSKLSMDITDRKWRILSFIENHNHDLSPSKSRHFAAFRHISTDTRRRLLINDNAGVRINSSIKSAIVEAGGYKNVTYNPKDVRNFLNKERRLKCKQGDGQALHDYFVRMQGKNSNFYHALDLDDELRVQNVFWVDARSRAAYESFHDVIIFDTTYLTNKEAMYSGRDILHALFVKRVTVLPDRTEVVRSPMVVRKGRPRTKRLKSSMEEAVSKPKKKRNTAAARNLAQSTSTTGVGGSAYGDGSTSNMEYPMSMPHSNDGVIDLTNPMPSQSFVSESMSQTQAHGYEDQALNLT